MNVQNVKVDGNKLTITREDLDFQLHACITLQKDCKVNNDFTTWLITAGHIEAIKDLLSCFEGNAEAV